MHEEAGIFGGLWKQNSHYWTAFVGIAVQINPKIYVQNLIM
jgi:hypothetical protein